MAKLFDAVYEFALIPILVVLAAGFWLAKVTAVVPEPYLVRATTRTHYHRLNSCRMSSFMSNKLGCTFRVNGTSGIQKLQLPPACASRPSHFMPVHCTN